MRRGLLAAVVMSALAAATASARPSSWAPPRTQSRNHLAVIAAARRIADDVSLGYVAVGPCYFDGPRDEGCQVTIDAVSQDTSGSLVNSQFTDIIEVNQHGRLGVCARWSYAPAQVWCFRISALLDPALLSATKARPALWENVPGPFDRVDLHHRP